MKHPAGCYRATQTGGVISSITTCAGSGSGETPHGVSGINLTVWGKARRRSTARTKPQHEPCWGFSTDVPRYETRQSARGARSASKQWDWAAASGPLPSAVSHAHIARDTLKASTPTLPGHNHNRALARLTPLSTGDNARPSSRTPVCIVAAGASLCVIAWLHHRAYMCYTTWYLPLGF
jgi:hypothetical protein